MGIKVGLCGVSWDYKQSLVPKVIEMIAGRITWVPPEKADLVIVGPFDCDLNAYKRNYVPKFFRARDVKETYLDKIKGIKLFHTNENIRPDKVKADFSISFDHTPHNPTNFRFPYWMEFIDWSKQGIKDQTNPRFGCLFDQDALLQPLDTQFYKRVFKAAFFTSHLVEPRNGLYALIKQFIDVDGFGAAFDSNIKNHAQSEIIKKQVLSDYVFNLCPENSMYPGYNTEKIPESFISGCIPITWTVPGKNLDFNHNAYINLADQNDLALLSQEWEDANLNELLGDRLETPLLLKEISIDYLVGFLESVVELVKY